MATNLTFFQRNVPWILGLLGFVAGVTLPIASLPAQVKLHADDIAKLKQENIQIREASAVVVQQLKDMNRRLETLINLHTKP
jgi:hypothetical protein